MSHCKKCINLIGWGALVYFTYKIYRYVTGVINISKELPVYLKNVLGESPSMNLTILLNRLTVTLSFSEDTIVKHADIAEIAQEYIVRYYPIFRSDHTVIKVIQKEPNAEIEKGEQDPVEIRDVPEKLEPETK
jgi:hypothetical protein